MTLTHAKILSIFQNTTRMPPASKLLGFELLDLSMEHGWVEVAFTAKPEFANPTGSVQGGFITAMLDDAMGVAASVHSGLTKIVPTLQLTVTFLHPVPVGRVVVRGEVLRLGRNTAQLAGVLRLPNGTIAATAMAAAAVRDIPPRRIAE
jgi:uncharacterized protein (TIGR00369 family)